MKNFLILYILTSFAAYEAEAYSLQSNDHKPIQASVFSIKISSGNIVIRPSLLPIIMKTDINYPLESQFKSYIEKQNMIYIAYKF